MSGLWYFWGSLALLLGGYFVYGAFVEKVFGADFGRLTPVKSRRDGVDYIELPRYKIFLIQLLNIAGLGPVIGPILGALYGPSALLWVVFGCIFGGAVHDYCSAMMSLRYGGASYPEIIGRNLGTDVRRFMEVFAIAFMIMVGAVFVLGPAALLANLTSFGLPFWATLIFAYYFLATIMPIDTIIGRIYPFFSVLLLVMAFGLAGSLMLSGRPVLPNTDFFVNTNPAGLPIWPLLFITIACGAVSGFHALISSGTTPKLLANETDARFIGYGAMLMESFVAIMALVAASIIEPGLYFAMNTPPAGLGITMPNLHEMGGENAAMIAAQLKEVTVHAAATVSSWGFVISPEQILQTAKDIGEPSVLNRAGGAPTLAVGIAHVFHKVLPMADMGFWYHFGILFEALFILTALDAGTRAGRFMLQDLLGNFVPFLKKTDSLVAGIIGTAGCVGLWGYLLYQGVVDPLGGVKSLWPLFGISNQMLAAVALVLGTVVLVKMQRTKYIWVTVIPAAWLLLCTTWALGLKLFSSNPQMEGFFFMAQQYKEKIAAGGELTAQQIANMNHIVVNNYTNAGLSILFLVVVYSIIWAASCCGIWYMVRNRPKMVDTPTTMRMVPVEMFASFMALNTSFRESFLVMKKPTKRAYHTATTEASTGVHMPA